MIHNYGTEYELGDCTADSFPRFFTTTSGSTSLDRPAPAYVPTEAYTYATVLGSLVRAFR